MKNSNFSAARLHLERAFDYLTGDDQISKDTRLALDLLIEGVATAEYSRKTAEIVQLPVIKRA